MRFALKTLNKELAKMIDGVELFRGNGYFYFIGEKVDGMRNWESIMMCNISDLSFDRWIEIFEGYVAKQKKLDADKQEIIDADEGMKIKSVKVEEKKESLDSLHPLTKEQKATMTKTEIARAEIITAISEMKDLTKVYELDTGFTATYKGRVSNLDFPSKDEAVNWINRCKELKKWYA